MTITLIIKLIYKLYKNGCLKSIKVEDYEPYNFLDSTRNAGAYSFIILTGITGVLISSSVVSSPMPNPLFYSYFLCILFPIVSYLIQVSLNMQYYVIPSILNNLISFIMAINLIIFYILFALYYILNIYIWIGVSVLVLFVHYLYWYFTKIDTKKFKKNVMNLYENNEITNIDNYDKWVEIIVINPIIKKIGFYWIVFMLIVLMYGYFDNHMKSMNEWYTPYGLSWGAFALSMMLYTGVARFYKQLLPLLEVMQEICEKEKLNDTRGQLPP